MEFNVTSTPEDLPCARLTQVHNDRYVIPMPLDLLVQGWLMGRRGGEQSINNHNALCKAQKQRCT